MYIDNWQRCSYNCLILCHLCLAVNNFFSVKVHTARVTALMAAGNVGYDTLQKLNTSFLQHNTENNHDKKLSIDSTTENSAAPINLSIMVLVCLGTIILGLYVASYKIDYFIIFKDLICDRNKNNGTPFDRNGSCDIWNPYSVNENGSTLCSRMHTTMNKIKRFF